MDHTNHVRLTASELTPTILEDAAIYGPNDEKIGSVSHVHGTGPATEVVIDVGGFLGIGAKPVAVPASQLDFMRDEDGEVHAVTTWTKDQLKDMPEHHDEGGLVMAGSRNAAQGTTNEKSRWEGPPENRPRGYRPAKDDPDIDRDASGENLQDPDKRDLGDALKTKGDK